VPSVAIVRTPAFCTFASAPVAAVVEADVVVPAEHPLRMMAAVATTAMESVLIFMVFLTCESVVDEPGIDGRHYELARTVRIVTTAEEAPAFRYGP